MNTITPKGWASFQHYKDRKPAWIKLHRDLLDNFDFHRLPVASKALAPCLWLLASEYEGGEIPADWSLIGFRLRMSDSDVRDAVTPLIDNGFFIASNTLADCKQDACLEKERETEKERDIPTPAEPASSKQKARKLSLTDWLDNLPEGELVIRSDDPIYEWAAQVGLDDGMIELAWSAFEAKYSSADRKYTDWRSVFRNAVRGNWLKLWYIRGDQYLLTTVGEQARRAAA